MKSNLGFNKLTLLIASLVMIVLCNGSALAQTVTFNYTGAVQQYVVPPCVTSISITARGGQGGGAPLSGNGAVVTGVIAVTPGQILQVYVGGQGICPNIGGTTLGGGGWNGGGNGWSSASGAITSSCGGGGASDVRIAPYALGNRVIVAGGGGGRNGQGGGFNGNGGTGGCANGGAGVPTFGGGGGGGTAAVGGAGGFGWAGIGLNGQAGALAVGGAGGQGINCNAHGGGGGGGLYGGGGGGGDGCCDGANGGGGGGGGSSLTPAGGTCNQNVNTGHGQVTITATGSSPVAGTASVAPASICSGQSTTVTLIGSSGNIQWQSSTDGGVTWTPVPGGTTIILNTGALTTTTCYSAQVTSCGTTVTTNTTCVTVNPLPVVTVNSPSICIGASATLTATVNPAGGTFSWAPGGQGTQSITVAPLSTTTYTVTYTAAGCTGTASGTATVEPLPQASFTTTPACPTSAIGLTNTSTISSGTISSWNWDITGGTPATSTLQTPTVSYATGGTYNITLTATSAAGCSSAVTNSVTIPYMPVPDFSFTQACFGAPTSFTDLSTVIGGTITGWTWVWGDGTPVGNTPNPTHTYAAPGTYAVTLIPTTNAGCTGPSVTYNVDVLALANSAFTVNNVCLGTPAAPVNTTVGGSTFSWDFGDGTPLASGANPTHNYAVPGNYTINMTSTTSSGCISSASQPITVFANPSASFTSANVCQGNLMNFTDNSAPNGGVLSTWQWDFGDGNSSSVQNPSNNYAASGSYSVTLTVTTTDGCANIVTLPVTVYPVPTALFTAPDVCLGAATNFQNQSTVSSGNISTHAWTFGNGNTSAIQNPMQTYTAPGPYNVTLIVTTNNNCTDTVTSTINIHDLPVADFTADLLMNCSPLCANFTSNSTAPAGNTIVNWSWDFGDGGASPVQNPGHCYTNNTFNTVTFNPTLTVTTNVGCSDVLTLPAYISVYAMPDASFLAGPQPTTMLNPEITFNNLTGGATNFIWDFGDSSGTSSNTNPVHTYLTVGNYEVMLIASNQFGCVDTIVQTVVIDDDFLVYVPNAFTPDGDGVNDIFLPYVNGFDPERFEFFIFNRWGQLVYQSNDVTKGWDGTFKSIKAKEDVYVWKIKVRDEVNHERREFMGHVTLLRGTNK